MIIFHGVGCFLFLEWDSFFCIAQCRTGFFLYAHGFFRVGSDSFSERFFYKRRFFPYVESDVFSIHLFSCGFGLFLSFFFCIKRFLSRVESDVFSDRCFYNRCFFSCWIKWFFRTDFLINGVFSRFWVYFFLLFFIDDGNLHVHCNG